MHDEIEIRALADKFSDAANRVDPDMFQSLWSPEGVWEVGPPINVKFEGASVMGSSVKKMLSQWEFFVQLTTSGVVQVNGKKAIARFYVNEIARHSTGKGHFNLAMYEDELEKINGKWLFAKRSYHILYLDESPLNGKTFPIPSISPFHKSFV